MLNKLSKIILSLLVPVLSFSQSSIYKYENNIDKLNRYLDSLDTKMQPGFSLLVLHKDSILLHRSFGYADLEKNKKIDDSTQFYIASVGKTFTAAAILKLRIEKKLNLEDRITKYINGLPSIMKDVRIYHLLTQTSGIPDFFDVLGEDLNNFYNKDVLAFTQQRDSLLFEPGVNYSYSNTAYNLLSLIIEKISGISYPEYLKQNFFIPLKMDHSIVIDRPGIQLTNKAIGYKIDSLKISKSDYEGIYTTGSGGTYSTVSDLAKWMIALKNAKIISKRSFDLMTDFPMTYSGAKSYFAMGWTNESGGGVMQGLKAFGAIGLLKGFTGIIKYFPDQDVSFIALTNSNQFRSDIYEKVIEFLFKKIQL